MNATKKLQPSILLIILVLVMLIASCTTDISKSSNPPETLQEFDLVGTWMANYGSYRGIDRLVLREDGLFQQTYENPRDGYVFQTSWNQWRLDHLADGRVRIYLKGARYYAGGEPGGELIATEPWTFCDPFAERGDDWTKWDINMIGKLVLNVRLLPSGELVLYHMWPGCADSAFLDKEVFHKQQ